MTWLNPAALLGLLALAVPILVHVFGRRVARRQRFPSLRLLREAQPTPARRSRPSDVLLLALRCLALAAAVAALAQPKWSGVGRTQAPVRVIVVDTSASMSRLTSDGTSALRQARSIAQRMLDSARNGIVLETDRPGSSIAGASSWLSRTSGLREVVVISDFQTGTMFGGHLAAVGEGMGTRMVRVQTAGLGETRDTVGSIAIDAGLDRTNATWLTSRTDSSMAMNVLAGDEDQRAVRASMAAARAVAPGVRRSGRIVQVVFPSHRSRSDRLAEVTALDSAWQGDLVVALQRDALIASTASTARVVPACETRGAPIAHNDRGETVASIGRIKGGILLSACVEPGSIAGAALIAGLQAALTQPPSMQELEPSFVPDEILRTWEHPAVEAPPQGREETSPDGRWLWLLAIAFLVAEEWVRRRALHRSAPSLNEAQRERVA